MAPGFRFSREQAAALAAPLDYREGLQVIAQAHRIFGFDGWGVAYIAKVRIAVADLLREGTGAGHGIDVDLGLAHESALKEAETDATKCALMTFGNPFGLVLYDKQQRQVVGGPPASPQTSHPQAGQPAAAPNNAAEAFNGPPRATNGAPAAAPVPTRLPVAQDTPAPDAQLDAATIGSLHERIRALQPPQLEAFSQAFRSAFQVPAEAPSIAWLITQQSHQIWIQQVLDQCQAATG